MDNSENEIRDKSAGEVENIVKDAFYNGDDDRAYEEIKIFLSSAVCSGSPDEFHNLSVSFSRKDDYTTACKILDKGLEKYPYSTDLLADYLQIGLFCNKEDECQKYYGVLFDIPKTKWTWRGFSFSIDYLQIITEGLNDADAILQNKVTMIKIADEYAKYYPYDEDVYLARSEIYNYFNEKENEINCLHEAVQQGFRSPKCNLRLADFYFSKGEYEKALEYVERNKTEGIDVQDRINVGYMYYLGGLCRTALLHINNRFKDVDAVMKIYQDFYIAEEIMDNKTSYTKNIERQVFVLETKTGIKYDDAIEMLTEHNNTLAETEDADSDNTNNEAASKRKPIVSKKRFPFLKK